MTSPMVRCFQSQKWMPLLILAAGLAVYSGTFSHPFLFDDAVVVTENADVYRLLPLRLDSRCVADFTFRLNYALHGFNVAGYHLVNLLIHICTGLLLFGVVRRTLERMVHGSWFMVGRGETSRVASQTINHSSHEARRATWEQPSTIALLAALLWVVHPMNTQAVTYISQRYESLMGMFYLLTLYCFVRGVQAVRPRRWFNGAIVACAMGMGTKEVMVSAPIMVLLYDLAFVSSSVRDLKQRWKFHAACFATLGIFAMLQVAFAARVAGLATLPDRVADVSPWLYLATEAEVILHYLRLALVPTRLCFDYAWPYATSVDASRLLLMAVVGGVGGATLVAWLRGRRRVAYLGFWFFVVLGPTSSVLPLPAAAVEHRMYVPLMAVSTLAVLLVCGAARAVGRWLGSLRRMGVTATVLCALWIASFGWFSFQRNRVYASEGSVWQDTLLKASENQRARVGYGIALMGQGRPQDAETQFRMVVDSLGSGASNRTSLSRAYAGLGALAFGRGRFEQAAVWFRAALAAAPANTGARNNLGVCLKRMGLLDNAMAQWRRSLALTGNNPQAHYLLADAYRSLAQPARAVMHYEATRALRQEWIHPRIALAWVLASSSDAAVRDPGRATALATKLMEAGDRLTPPQRVRVLDVLGIAAAADGEFDVAVQRTEAALQMAEQIGVSGMEAVVERVQRYQKGRPYRE